LWLVQVDPGTSNGVRARGCRVPVLASRPLPRQRHSIKERKLLSVIWNDTLEIEIQRAEGCRAKYKLKEGRRCPASQPRHDHRAPVLARAWLLRGISVNFNESLLIIGLHLQAALKDVVSSPCLLSPHLKQCHHDLQQEAPIKRKELLFDRITISFQSLKSRECC
jgi:hypothetical protein